MKLLLLYAFTLLAGIAFCSEPDVVGELINADLIKPAALAYDVWHAGHAALFQLSRAPGLVPDIAAYVALSGLFPAWRMAAIAYAATSYLGLVAALGAIVAAIARRPLLPATAWVLALSIAAMAADILWFGSMHPTLLVFSPDVHSGPLILAFAALLLVAARIRRPALYLDIGLFTLAALGTLSDRLFVGTFVLPAAAGVALLVLARQLPWRQGLRIVLTLAIGCIVGTRLDHALFAQILLRQADVPLGSPRRHLLLLLGSPTLIPVVALETLLIAIAVIAWRRLGAGLFWVGAFLAMTGGHLALYAALYTDDALLRYVQPVFWWAVIWIAAAATRLLWQPASGLAAATAMAALLAVETARAPPFPKMLAWQLPLAACLRDAHAAGRLHDGLAEYWVARPIEVAADWQLQVDQITADGGVFLWGNNRFWYTHARNDPAHPPTTDFIVMDRLQPAAIQERFGPPASTLPCPGSDIWIYPAGIHDSVGGILTAAQRDPAVTHDLCLRPRDFRTDANGLRGPFLTLAPGRWRMRLHYRLDTPGHWDAFGNIDHIYAAGDLPTAPTGTLDTTFDLPKAVQGFDFRFTPAQGMTLATLSLTRDGSTQDPCP